MKLLLRLPVILFSGLLAACAAPSLVIGQPRAALKSEEVVIYYMQRPLCDFETVAHIQVNGGYYSLDSMLKNMRSAAAEVGAGGLYVLHTQQLEVKEYLGTAKAIRCLTAWGKEF